MRISKADFDRLLARRAGQPKPSEPSAGSEMDLHDQIIDYCRANGLVCLRSRPDRDTGRPPGEPDFIIAAPVGRVHWIECKSAKGKLRPEQASMQAHLGTLGHSMIVVRSMAEFLEAIK